MLNNIPIFLSSDNNYAPFVATTIASICDNTKSFIDFYVLDGGITPENRTKIESLKTRFQNFSVEFIEINKGLLSSINYRNDAKYVTIATYNRFLIPELKPSIKKSIYLDVDVILNDDILKLYSEELSGFPVGAVADINQNCEYLNHLKNAVGLKKESSYFNAGVLLLDCEKWRQDNIKQELFEIEKTHREKLKMADQDVLNIYFENNYKLLDKKYNVILDNNEIIIRHFASSVKPWQADFYLDNITKKPAIIKNSELFWKYAEMTPFYEKILLNKKSFLDSNILYQRFNKMVTGVQL